MRALIGFFGLTRSLRYTAASISQAIYEPLRRAGVPTLRAGHFNQLARLENPRSGESCAAPDQAETDLLALDLTRHEPQSDINVAAELAAGRRFPDRFGDDYRSLANLCHQLRSLAQLWSMMQAFQPSDDDVVLLLRPDLRYLDALDPHHALTPLLGGRIDLIVPGWQGWGGVNDRFAFCTAAAAAAYASRIGDFANGCTAMGGMHSERFLAYSLKQHRLHAVATSLRAVRVRANGAIAGNDVAMLETAA